VTTHLVEFEDREYEYDWKITVRQAMEIHEGTGWGVRTFNRLVDDWHPTAVKWLWWLINDKNGVTVDVAKIPDDWDFSGFMVAMEAATMARALELAEAEKRNEAGRTPKGSKRGIPSSAASKKTARTGTSARSSTRTSSGSPTSAT
jgi:hypothetical protein